MGITGSVVSGFLNVEFVFFSAYFGSRLARFGAELCVVSGEKEGVGW